MTNTKINNLSDNQHILKIFLHLTRRMVGDEGQRRSTKNWVHCELTLLIYSMTSFSLIFFPSQSITLKTEVLKRGKNEKLGGIL